MVLLKDINRLTLFDMMQSPMLYEGLVDGLIELPVPDEITIKKKTMKVPQTLDEYSANICYGQRLYLSREEPNDFGIILRLMLGYFYPLLSEKTWDIEAIDDYVKFVVKCLVKDLYPVTIHLTKLFGELIERERKYLYREPTSIERAAGIENLNIYSELNALDFLRDTMKITEAEVLITPYNDCLVRFMNAKANMTYQDRYIKLTQEKNELIKQSKFKKK